MTAVITHSVSAGGAVDPTASVDGAAWDANHVITGIVDLAQGGTNADLSATGGAGQVLKQASAGAAVTVGTVAASEIANGAALTKTDDTNVTLRRHGRRRLNNLKIGHHKRATAAPACLAREFFRCGQSSRRASIPTSGPRKPNNLKPGPPHK